MVQEQDSIFFNGQLLSFEKDLNNARSQLIDLNSVLLIFLNGVIQKAQVQHTLSRVVQHLSLLKHLNQMLK